MTIAVTPTLAVSSWWVSIPTHNVIHTDGSWFPPKTTVHLRPILEASLPSCTRQAKLLPILSRVSDFQFHIKCSMEKIRIFIILIPSSTNGIFYQCIQWKKHVLFLMNFILYFSPSWYWRCPCNYGSSWHMLVYFIVIFIFLNIKKSVKLLIRVYFFKSISGIATVRPTFQVTSCKLMHVLNYILIVFVEQIGIDLQIITKIINPWCFLFHFSCCLCLQQQSLQPRRQLDWWLQVQLYLYRCQKWKLPMYRTVSKHSFFKGHNSDPMIHLQIDVSVQY